MVFNSRDLTYLLFPFYKENVGKNTYVLKYKRMAIAVRRRTMVEVISIALLMDWGSSTSTSGLSEKLLRERREERE
jgi:hypothetical protein